MCQKYGINYRSKKDESHHPLLSINAGCSGSVFERYSQQEVDLIPSLVPTYTNVKNLTKSLGRTQDAIYVVYNYTYSGRWLKRDLAELDEH